MLVSHHLVCCASYFLQLSFVKSLARIDMNCETKPVLLLALVATDL